jgi:hypothetical protein
MDLCLHGSVCAVNIQLNVITDTDVYTDILAKDHSVPSSQLLYNQDGHEVNNAPNGFGFALCVCVCVYVYVYVYVCV